MSARQSTVPIPNAELNSGLAACSKKKVGAKMKVNALMKLKNLFMATSIKPMAMRHATLSSMDHIGSSTMAPSMV